MFVDAAKSIAERHGDGSKRMLLLSSRLLEEVWLYYETNSWTVNVLVIGIPQVYSLAVGTTTRQGLLQVVHSLGEVRSGKTKADSHKKTIDLE